MLVSLSKLVSKSKGLISEQVLLPASVHVVGQGPVQFFFSNSLSCNISPTSLFFCFCLALLVGLCTYNFLISLMCFMCLSISIQVTLLLSCLSQENTLQLRVTALRCLHLIFVKEGCFSPVNMHVIKTLFSILDESELPSAMQCGALQILHKVIPKPMIN